MPKKKNRAVSDSFGLIPIILVCGFLGSGKTTLLRRIHDNRNGKLLVFLINEYSLRDVDARLLGRDSDQVFSVSGGSIFCTCKVTEFIGQLKKIAERFPSANGVIIEASGMANPSSMAIMLAETGLDSLFRLQQIITVVDAVTLPGLLQTLPNIRRQIECAGLIVLNKADLVDEDTIRRASQLLDEINPGVPRSVTRYCALDEDLLERPACPVKAGSQEAGDQEQEQVAKFSLQTSRGIAHSGLKALTRMFPGKIFRIKGVLTDGCGQNWRIDYSISSGLIISKKEPPVKAHLEFIFSATQAQSIIREIKKLPESGLQST